jgi:hypothetical protein
VEIGEDEGDGGALTLTPRIMTTALIIIAAWAQRYPWPTRHRDVAVGASNPGCSGRVRGQGKRQRSRRLSLSLSAVRGRDRIWAVNGGIAGPGAGCDSLSHRTGLARSGTNGAGPTCPARRGSFWASSPFSLFFSFYRFITDAATAMQQRCTAVSPCFCSGKLPKCQRNKQAMRGGGGGGGGGERAPTPPQKMSMLTGT